MSSRTDLVKLLACLAAACLATACAGADAAKTASGNLCPARQGTVASQIDLFDGDPAEQAFLAPDGDEKGPDIYTVKGIYDQGRYVTIRCHYGKEAVDVKLVKPVSRCTYSGGDAHPALACK
jgi:hypothetical protein